MKAKRKTVKKKKPLKHKKVSNGVVLRMKETIMTGTEYENKVSKVCSENMYPLIFHNGRVGNKVPDFINQDKKKIVEVYNPVRTDEEVHARLLAFHTKSFKVRQLVKHDLTRPDWEQFLAGIIGRFLRD